MADVDAKEPVSTQDEVPQGDEVADAQTLSSPALVPEHDVNHEDSDLAEAEGIELSHAENVSAGHVEQGDDAEHGVDNTQADVVRAGAALTEPAAVPSDEAKTIPATSLTPKKTVKSSLSVKPIAGKSAGSAPPTPLVKKVSWLCPVYGNLEMMTMLLTHFVRSLILASLGQALRSPHLKLPSLLPRLLLPPQDLFQRLPLLPSSPPPPPPPPPRNIPWQLLRWVPEHPRRGPLP